MNFRVQAWVTATVVLSVCACAGNEESAARNVAEFDAPVTWTLSEDPIFRIPGVEIAGDSLFLHIVIPGTFTRQGDIAVALTQGEYQVLYVDTLGTGIDVFGRTGDGPGGVPSAHPRDREPGYRGGLGLDQRSSISVRGS